MVDNFIELSDDERDIFFFENTKHGPRRGWRDILDNDYFLPIAIQHQLEYYKRLEKLKNIHNDLIPFKKHSQTLYFHTDLSRHNS